MLDLQLGLDLGSYAAKRRPTPIDLFRSGEEGVWYDPSDLSTLFQDSAGTTPVTADGDPVGLMLDKSKGLVLGPELVTNGTFDGPDISAWIPVSTSLSIESGRLRIESTGNGFTSAYLHMTGLVPGSMYSVTAGEVGVVTRIRIYDNAATSGLISTSSAGGTSIKFTSPADGNVAVHFANTSSTIGDVAFIDNISVRELPGNHATQSTSAARPTYQRGDSRGVVNLLKWSEDFGNGVWVRKAGGTGSVPVITPDAAIGPDGDMTADRVQLNAGSGATTSDFSILDQSVSVQNIGYVHSIYLKSWDGTNQQVYLRRNSNFAAGTEVTVTNEWQRFDVAITPGAGARDWGLDLRSSLAASCDILVSHPQLEEGSTATPYQRNDSHLGGVATGLSTDLRWLSFDGVDDYLATAAGVGISGSNNRELALSGTGSVVTINPLGGTGERWSFRPNNGANRARIEIQGSGHNSPLVSGLNVWGCRLDGPTLADNTLSVGTTEAAASGADAINTVDGPLSVGRININTFDPGEVYGLILLDRLLSVPDRTSTRNYLAKKAGVVL